MLTLSRLSYESQEYIEAQTSERVKYQGGRLARRGTLRAIGAYKNPLPNTDCKEALQGRTHSFKLYRLLLPHVYIVELTLRS